MRVDGVAQHRQEPEERQLSPRQTGAVVDEDDPGAGGATADRSAIDRLVTTSNILPAEMLGVPPALIAAWQALEVAQRRLEHRGELDGVARGHDVPWRVGG